MTAPDFMVARRLLTIAVLGSLAGGCVSTLRAGESDVVRLSAILFPEDGYSELSFLERREVEASLQSAADEVLGYAQYLEGRNEIQPLRPIRRFSVEVVPGDDPNASAQCDASGDVIRVTDSLVRGLFRVSLDAGTSWHAAMLLNLMAGVPIDGEPVTSMTPTELATYARRPLARRVNLGFYSYERVLNYEETSVRLPGYEYSRKSRGRLRASDVAPLSLILRIKVEYAMSTLWMMGHEASHLWMEPCPRADTRSSREEERAADAFGARMLRCVHKQGQLYSVQRRTSFGRLIREPASATSTRERTATSLWRSA